MHGRKRDSGTCAHSDNNYRGMASVDQSKLNAATQAEADTNNPPQDVVSSNMLTIWRKLHVEVDSMAAEPTTVADRSPDWDLVTVNLAQPNQSTSSTTLTVTSQTTLLGGLASSEQNHYEGGTLTVAGLTLMLIGSGSSTLEVDRVLTQAEQASIIGATGTLRDDDPISQLPMYPSITPFIKGAYDKAYIDIVPITGASNLHPTVDFDLNLSDFELQTGQGYDNSQDIFSSSEYWAALLVVALQPAADADQDSDPWLGSNTAPSGVNPGADPYVDYGVTVEDSDNASLIFIEVLRDWGANAVTDIDHTIAHEIGHSAGANTPPDQDHGELGIMTDEAPASENAFSAESLKRFREADLW